MAVLLWVGCVCAGDRFPFYKVHHRARSHRRSNGFLQHTKVPKGPTKLLIPTHSVVLFSVNNLQKKKKNVKETRSRTMLMRGANTQTPPCTHTFTGRTLHSIWSKTPFEREEKKWFLQMTMSCRWHDDGHGPCVFVTVGAAQDLGGRTEAVFLQHFLVCF